MKNLANPVGGKTARACDSCMTKRARWYCAADDAFLCQACDSSVHSANPLARRHERLRLKTASYKSSCRAPPSWHHKKARTPRHGGKQHPSARNNNNNPFHLVPEVYSDEVNSSHEENEERLLYRVPILEPFERTELCTSPPSSSVTTSAELGAVTTVAAENKGAKKGSDESKVVSLDYNNNHVGVESLHGFVPSEIELAEFAADVESLLGRGLENECMGMEELGLVDTSVGSDGKVKMEDEESTEVVVASAACKNKMMEMEGETFELIFDYDDSHETCEEVKDKVALEINDGELMKENDEGRKRRNQKLLQLDYEGVISAWASHKCPWTTGDKPNLDPDECWPHCMGICGTELHNPYGGFGCHPFVGDGGREARVSRYREKRRTRLFSKKIRYEVRKLNAEKRPRMKGRFVKRASFTAPTFPLLNK